MTDKPKSTAIPLSRRALLRGTGGAGAAFILAANPNAATAAPKLSQQVVAYQDHPVGEKRCDRCAHFQPPSGCQIVEGSVRPDGYCKFFTPRSPA